MIKFKDTTIRQSGVIYNGSFNQIKMLYEKDPQQAGELAISLIELTLTGQMSTDDFVIQLLLENQAQIIAKDKKKYDNKVAATESKRYEKLAEVAKLYNLGYKQKEIAEALGKSPSTISENIAAIRAEYPELLNSEKKFGKFGKFGTDNENENDNENVNDNNNENDNDNVNDNENENVAEQMLAGSKKKSYIADVL